MQNSIFLGSDPVYVPHHVFEYIQLSLNHRNHNKRKKFPVWGKQRKGNASALVEGHPPLDVIPQYSKVTNLLWKVCTFPPFIEKRNNKKKQYNE